MDANRLVVISQEYPPDKSGLASRMRDLTTNIDDEGWEVDVVAPPPSFPHGEFDRRWYRSRRTTVDGVTVHRIWAWQTGSSDPGMLSRLAYYLTFALHATLWLLVRHRRFDVILTTTPPLTTGLAGFIPSVAGVPWVVDIRDLWLDTGVSVGLIEEDGVFERTGHWFQRQVLGMADSVSVTTETIGERLSERYGPALTEKVIVVPNGVDTSRFRPPDFETPSSDNARDDLEEESSEDPPTIVYAGNIGHAQALDVCVQAITRLSEDALFRLVGGGDVVSDLKRLAADLGVDDRVRFSGLVPREEIPDILREADVGVAPIIDTERMAYAIPTKVYEYHGAGLPVVVTGRGEVKRFVESSGGGVHVEADPDAIAAALDELLADDEHRRAMAKAGYEYVHSTYDRRRIAADFSDHLRSLLRERPPAGPQTEALLNTREK